MASSPTAEATLDAEAVQAFAMGIRGPVLQPGDPGYDDARAIWNGLIDRRPALIVQCTGAADVVDAVTSHATTASSSPSEAAVTTSQATPSTTAASSSTCRR